MSDGRDSQELAQDWTPTSQDIEQSNIAALMRKVGFSSYRELHRWSVAHRDEFWRVAIEMLGVDFDHGPSTILDGSDGIEHARWLPDARWNIVDSCLSGSGNGLAVIEGAADGQVRRTSLDQLRALTARISTALWEWGIRPGDRVAMLMPMHCDAVACYLAIVRIGAAVVGIAESFSSAEIAVRLKLSGAKLVVTQDAIVRAGKTLPLYSRLCEIEDAPSAVVRPNETAAEVALSRDGDISWGAWLELRSQPDLPVPSVAIGPEDEVGVLFSSGTTGDPKVIPWSNLCPLKCAADAMFHHDTHAGDVLAWPTSLGWMMGPWLIYAALLNRASIALFDDIPSSAAFCRFVQDSGVTMLGVVPSLVAAWRAADAVSGSDWSAIRLFSSTGECSIAGDMAWLMSQAGGRPVIEYCGGTEIAGGYITGVIVRTCRAGQFNTPALGLDVVILDEMGRETEQGELYISPPSIGLSSRLLNRSHHDAYYADCPQNSSYGVLRRHGDEVQSLGDGYYRAHGRVDDTMNLGGIKVSSAEIERVLDDIAGVRELAAVAESDPEGGPSRLVIYAAVEEPTDRAAIPSLMSKQVRQRLNPLFKIDRVEFVERLPRTASNKVMRRRLRKSVK